MLLAVSRGVETISNDDHRYSARCVHCARTIFSAARRIGDIQLRMAEYHILVCRPLAPIQQSSELLRHFTIADSVA